MFFEAKKAQSEIVDNWVDKTIINLKSRYLTVLNFAGLIRIDGDKNEIMVPLVDYRIKQLLIDNDLGPYLYAITGEK